MTYWDEIDPKAPLPDPDAEKLPLRYEIVESDRKSPSDRIAEENLRLPFAAEAEAEKPAVAVGTPVAQPPFLAQPPFYESWLPKIREFFSNPTKVYATVGVALGVVFGITVAAITWHIYNPNGPYDLGTVASNAVGLNGHLFLRWNRKLEYRLSFEPSDPDRAAGFAVAAGSPPRPLSMNIQLLDAQGFVLCSKDILFKFDPSKAAAYAASSTEPQAGGAGAAAGQPQAADFAQLNAQEASREQGKDIFQNQLGPDGQIASVSAEGNFECSGKSYEATSTWSVTPNFPSLAEQDAWLKRATEFEANETLPPAEKAAVRKRLAAKGAVKPPPPFYVEGDDSIVGFDPSTGTIETVSGKTFLIDKASAEANVIKNHDLPIEFHYRCDQGSTCTLSSGVLGMLHTRLRR